MRSCELTKVSLKTDVDERCRWCIPYNNDDNTRQLITILIPVCLIYYADCTNVSMYL